MITKEELKTRGVAAVGSVAGLAADPKTGVRQLARVLPTALATGAGLLIGFVLGYRAARRW